MLFPVFCFMIGSESHDNTAWRARGQCADGLRFADAPIKSMSLGVLSICVFLLHGCIWVAAF